MGIDEVITEEIKRNETETTQGLKELRENSPRAIREYVERASQIRGVLGIFYGVEGTRINLLDIVESDNILIDSAIQDLLSQVQLEIAREHDSLYIHYRTVGSCRRTLAEIEVSGEIPTYLADDDYAGKDVKKIYPLA